MRLVWILLSSLACAALVLATSLGLAALAAPDVPNGRALAARLLLDADARSTRRLLEQTCQRDMLLERLLLELASGGSAPDATREAAALGQTLGGELRLFVERAAELSELGTSGAEPVTSELLHAAGVRRLALNEPPSVLDACRTQRDGTRVWLLRSAALPALLAELGLSADGFRVARADEPSAAGGDEVARLPLATQTSAQLRIAALGASENQDAALGFVVLLSVFALLLGAGFGYLATRPTPAPPDAVLSELERAAERVARGDLSSQITLRVGGRADQTFQTFDRMTAELRETRAKLADAERAAAWQDMARRIAHEIKNPLLPIKVALETLRKAHAKQLPDFDEIFAESTRAVLEEVERLTRIVREFSEFARLPRARPGALELGKLLDETVALYTPDDVRVEVQAGPRELNVHADREQLVQVVVNLLSNALDAARTASAPHVIVGAASEGEQVELWVDDNGPGVPEAERERIFEPYVTSKAQGTGLGLSIVRRIAQEHGGKVSVSASPLGGARFSLRLPRAPA